MMGNDKQSEADTTTDYTLPPPLSESDDVDYTIEFDSLDEEMPPAKLEFEDAYTELLRHGPDDGEYEIDITYRKDKKRDDYGPIEKRGLDITREHPVDDIEEIKAKQHLTPQLRRAHRVLNEDQEKIAGRSDDESVIAFSKAILDVAGLALTTAGVPLSDPPIPEPFIKSLLLHDALGFDSRPRLERHLKKKEIGQKAGFNTVPDQSTIKRQEDTLENKGLRDNIRDASIRAVDALIRNNTVVPEEVLQAHELFTWYEVNENKVPYPRKQEAMRNWIRFLFPDILSPLDLDRDWTKHSVEGFIGMLALSALVNTGPQNHHMAYWFDADQDGVPDGGGLFKHVSDLDLKEIEEMFEQVHLNFFEAVTDLGFFTERKDIAFDPTTITWHGKNTEWTIGSGKHSDTDVWFLPGLAVMDTDARFLLGINIVWKKSNTTNVLQKQLKLAKQSIPIKHIYTDAEFFDASAAEISQNVIGDGWIIRAKDIGEISDLLEEAEPDEPEYASEVDVAGIRPKPGAFAYPTPNTDSDTTQNPSLAEEHDDEKESSHDAYLTGLSVEDLDLEDIHYTYIQRGSIEPLFNQLKNHFHPFISSGDEKIRLFCLNVSMLFYNIHTLINRVKSPQYGLRLDFTHQEVLAAILQVTASRNAADEPE